MLLNRYLVVFLKQLEISNLVPRFISERQLHQASLTAYVHRKLEILLFNNFLPLVGRRSHWFR